MAKTDDVELIKAPETRRLSGHSIPQIYRLERQGKFPKRVKIGRSSFWVRSEVIEWNRSKVEAFRKGRPQ